MHRLLLHHIKNEMFTWKHIAETLKFHHSTYHDLHSNKEVQAHLTSELTHSNVAVCNDLEEGARVTIIHHCYSNAGCRGTVNSEQLYKQWRYPQVFRTCTQPSKVYYCTYLILYVIKSYLLLLCQESTYQLTFSWYYLYVCR